MSARTGQRMYAKQSVYDAHLSSKKHLKAAEKLSGTAAPTNGIKPISRSRLRLRLPHSSYYNSSTKRQQPTTTG